MTTQSCQTNYVELACPVYLQPLRPPSGEVAEETPVQNLQQALPHRQQRSPAEPCPSDEAITQHSKPQSR